MSSLGIRSECGEALLVSRGSGSSKLSNGESGVREHVCFACMPSTGELRKLVVLKVVLTSHRQSDFDAFALTTHAFNSRGHILRSKI
jgi:hypothetical protein